VAALPSPNDGSLETAYDAGAAAWPALRIARPRFSRFAAERAAVSGFRGADLYLACGLVDQVPEALALFESHFMPSIVQALRRIHASTTQLEDLVQQLRIRLFVPDAAAPAAIEKYSGSGSLAGWLRVVATRMAIRELNRRPDAVEADIVRALLATTDDPELKVLKDQCRRAVGQAVERAVLAIDQRSRELLRYHLIEGLGCETIAPLYGVHRTTALRWLEKARAGLVTATRRELMRTLAVSADQVESVLRVVRSQLDLSIGRYLPALA
jgi:RNA polymerase sigma-70 factor, ECF subfamily